MLVAFSTVVSWHLFFLMKRNDNNSMLGLWHLLKSGIVFLRGCESIVFFAGCLALDFQCFLCYAYKLISNWQDRGGSKGASLVLLLCNDCC